MQHVDACPICEHQQFVPFVSITDNSRDISYVLCKNCGLVLQSPHMDPHELHEFYLGAYRLDRQASEEPTGKDLSMQRARAERTLASVKDSINKIDRHLDIGSSSGALLHVFQEHFGCESVGIEPGQAYRDFSRKNLARVYPSQSALEAASEKPFDLISMMHVLEHLPDPMAKLCGLRENLLSPNGRLLVEVPNLFEHSSFELAHLYAFSASTLRALLDQAGFEIIWFRKHGSFRSPVLKLYLTVLAQPSSRPRSIRRFYFPGSHGVALRRRLGTLKRNFFTKNWPDWTWQSP
jgi:SAM-dependent methyltransferase